MTAWGEGLVFALLWGAPFVLLVTLGLQLTSTAEAAAITPTSMPVFAGLFGWLFLGERPARLRGLGYAAIAVGVACLIAGGAASQAFPNILGLAALALSAAMWGGYTLLFRNSGLTAIQSASLICLWSSALFLPAYIAFGLSRFGAASANEILLQVIYQGVLMSGVAIVTFNRAVSVLGPAAATAIIALLPVVASMLAIPVLGETPSAGEWAAIVVIITGVVLAALPARSPNPTPSN